MKRRPVAERIDVTLEGLRAVHRRIGLQKLEEGDWQLVGALVLNLIARTQSRQERMIAKIRAAEVQAEVRSQASDGRCAAQPDSNGHDPRSGPCVRAYRPRTRLAKFFAPTLIPRALGIPITPGVP